MLIISFLVFVLALGIFASPIVALIAFVRVNRLERRLQDTTDELRRQIDALADRVVALQESRRVRESAEPVLSVPAPLADMPTPVTSGQASTAPDLTVPDPIVLAGTVSVATGPRPGDDEATPVAPSTVAAVLFTSAEPAARAPDGQRVDDLHDAALPSDPGSDPDATSEPPRAAPVFSPLDSSPPAPPFWRTFDWEGLVGVKLFSAIAGIALALAGVFFLRFSIDHGWLQPPVRAALGILTSTMLLVVCEQRFARRYRVTANALDAGALAVLFATFFASHARWHLIGTPTTFLLLALVTALAVFLSVRRDSLFIAVLGLLGGFATPALLGSDHDNPIGLFGYLLLLNAGLSWVAYLKRWPALTVLSLALTFTHQWTWVLRFLSVQNLPLAAGIFLVFPILSFGALVLGRRLHAGEDGDDDGDRDSDRDGDRDGGREGGNQADARRGASVPWLMRFGPTTAVSAALPLLLATYLAAVPEFGAQYWLLFGFLFCLVVGLFAIAMLRGFYILHFIGALSAVMVTLVWLGLSYQPAAWPDVLGILAIFILFYLGAPLIAARLGRDLREPASRAHLASALFFAFFAVLARLEPVREALPLLFGTLFVLLAIVGVYAMARRSGVVYFVAAFFGVAAEAAWSATHLTPDRLGPALLLYTGFGLLYLGIPEMARRLKRPLEPAGAGSWLLLASLALLFFLAEPGVAAASLWGIAVLLAVLNAGLFVESLAARQAWLTYVGIGLSWLVLMTWWATVPLAPILTPAVTVLVGYALLVFGGIHWMNHRAAATATSDDLSPAAPALAFVAYGFLAHLAMAPDLGVPAWLLFAALAVLAAAVAFAALRTRRGGLHLTATTLSTIVLLLWTSAVSVVTPGSTWAMLSIAAILTSLAGAVGTYAIAQRRRLSDTTFAAAIVAAAFLGLATLVFDLPPSAARGMTWLVAPAHALCVVATLIVAWRHGWTTVPLYAVGMSGLVLTLNLSLVYATKAPMAHFWLSVVVYACYLANPVVLGRRAGAARGPYLTAALASGLFFYLARFDLIRAGYASIIALLPVAQALIVGALVLLLLRIEPAGQRAQGRLALIAGTALAFVTVAIPLQFEKEWLTLGWALEAAALAWLYGRIPHRGLLIAASGLAAVVFVRLAANPDVFLYAPRSDRPILNWYLYTYLVASVAFFLAARLLQKTMDRLIAGVPGVSTLLAGAATILLFYLLNIEIADFFSTGPTLTFRFTATLGQDLTYTLGWLVFGGALLGAGIALASRPARMAALGLLVATILKCFLHDLGRLGGLYRVGAFVGLAICLTLVAVALQRFVLKEQKPALATADGPSPE